MRNTKRDDKGKAVLCGRSLQDALEALASIEDTAENLKLSLQEAAQILREAKADVGNKVWNRWKSTVQPEHIKRSARKTGRICRECRYFFQSTKSKRSGICVRRNKRTKDAGSYKTEMEKYKTYAGKLCCGDFLPRGDDLKACNKETEDVQAADTEPELDEGDLTLTGLCRLLMENKGITFEQLAEESGMVPDFLRKLEDKTIEFREPVAKVILKALVRIERWSWKLFDKMILQELKTDNQIREMRERIGE